jgi:hypothetical protein
MTQWFYQLLGEEFGPVSESSLQQLQEDGTLSGSDLVRPAADSAANWLPLSRVTLGQSGQSHDDHDVLTDIDAINVDFGGSDSPAAAPSVKSTKTAVAEAAPKSNQYYYQFFGQVLGPIPLDTLVRMAEAGRLAETDLVRAEEDFLWQAAAEFSELSAAFLLRALPEQESPSSDSAAVTNSDLAPKPSAAPEPAPAKPNPPVPRTPSATAKSKKQAGRKKSRQADEKLVDNILSEVFAEDDSEEELPQTQATAAASPPPAPQQHPPVQQVEAAPPGPRNWASLNNSSSSQLNATASSATNTSTTAAARTALRSPPRKTSSSRGPLLPFNLNLEFNGPVKALLGLAVIAAFWFGYSPLMRYFKTDEARYISRMELAIETVEKLNPLTELPKFKGQQELMNKEFGAYAALMTEVGSTRQAARNCLGALNRLLEFSKVEPGNVGLQQKLLDDAKKLIGKYKGE